MGRWQIVEHSIEQEILSGNWKIGSRLPSERELAARFGVSRSTLRIAMTSLVARGIVETLHGSGTTVHSLPSGKAEVGAFRDRVEASALVFPPLAAACAMRLTPAQLLRLEELIGFMGTALRSDDAAGFVKGQVAFLAGIAELCGNPCAAAAAAVCLPGRRAVAVLTASWPAHRREVLFSELARLLGALRHADAADAETAARRYFAELMSASEVR